MNEIHEQWSEKSPAYADWHRTNHHGVVHWIVAIAVIAGIATFVFIQLNKETPQSLLLVDFSRSSAVLTLDPAQKSIKAGESFSVNIILDTAQKPIDGVDIYSLHYDPSILAVIDDISDQKGVQIKPGSLMGVNAVNKVNETSGSIIFSQVSTGGSNYSGKGVLATVTFKALNPGDTFLKFDFKKGSTIDTNAAHNGKDQLAHVVDALYTVTAK